jgi:hypothetical protein
MTQTTETQIAAIKALCKNLLPAVKTADVNDWGRFGNFDIMVTPLEHTRHTTTRLKAMVRKLLPPGAHLRHCFAPTAIRASQGSRHYNTQGYDCDYWSFDIDFQVYDSTSNSFQQKTAGAWA